MRCAWRSQLEELNNQHVVIVLESWLQSIRIRKHSFNILTEFNNILKH